MVSIIRGALALGSTQPVTWATTLAAFVFVPRLLGAQSLGQVAIATSIAALVGTLTSLGTNTYLTRRVAANPPDAARVGGEALVILVGFSLIAAALVSGFAVLVGFQLVDPVLLTIALFTMVVSRAQIVVSAVLNGKGRHTLFAWFNAAASVCGVLAGLAVLAAGGGLALYMLATLAALTIVIGIGLHISRLKVERSAFSPPVWRELAIGGLPFLGWDAAYWVRSQIDVLLVGVFLQAAAAGRLAAAYRIIGITVFVPTLIATPLLPALTRTAPESPVFGQTVRRSAIMVFLMSLFASTMIFAIAPAVPDLLGWGPSFDAFVPLVRILSLQQPLVALDIVLGTALIALRKERTWSRVMIVASAFNALANLMLIPLFEHFLANGAIGAAVVEVASEVLMLIGALKLLPVGIIDRSTIVRIASVALAGALAMALTSFVQVFSLPLALVCDPAIFACSIVGLRVVSLSGVRQIGAHVPTLLGRTRLSAL